MAVYAAHLTRTLAGTPSVFQVAAQEALGNTVKPALRKLVEESYLLGMVGERLESVRYRTAGLYPTYMYLATVYPNKCSWLVDWYDELYLVFDFFLQYHYLKHYAASFSESFYGLVRAPTLVSGEFNSGPRLPAWAERGSLALLVVAPYLRDKAERLAERWREDDEDGKLGKSPSDNLRRAAVKLYSAVHLVCESARLLQLAAYLSGRALAPTPALAALTLTLRDAPPQEAQDHTWTDLVKNIFTGQIGSAMVTFPMVGGLLLRGAEYGAFWLQLLRWREARGGAPATLPPPPPPERDERSLRWKNKCPLCLQTWRVPTALPVSGYIFCYVCISRHLRSARACPVTGYPATEQALVRLYVDD